MVQCHWKYTLGTLTGTATNIQWFFRYCATSYQKIPEFSFVGNSQCIPKYIIGNCFRWSALWRGRTGFWFCFFSAMSWYLVELYCYSVCRKPEDCSFCTLSLKGAVLCGISINSSLSGHCHEKNLDGSHDKEKYFEHHESVTAVAEGHSEGGTEDPEVLTQGSARDPSILRLESKSA